jgi:hypothetical protein
MAASSIVFDSVKPSRLGNSIFGVITGQFADAAVSYADALAAVQPKFLGTNPPVRVMYILVTGTTYAFIAIGRCV